MEYEIQAIKPTKTELKNAGFPLRAGVLPVRNNLRCCICGQFVSRKCFDFEIEGIEDGLICPKCNVDFEPHEPCEDE